MPSEGNPNRKSSDQIQKELDAIEARNRERDVANAKLQQKMEEALKALGASTGSGGDPSAPVPPESAPPLPAERAKKPFWTKGKILGATTAILAGVGIPAAGVYALKKSGSKMERDGNRAPTSETTNAVQTDTKKETNAPGYTASAGTDAWTLGPKQRAETNPILTELKEYAPNIPKTPEQPPTTKLEVVEIGQRTPPLAPATNVANPVSETPAPAVPPAVVDPAPTIPSEPVNLPPKPKVEPKVAVVEPIPALETASASTNKPPTIDIAAELVKLSKTIKSAKMEPSLYNTNTAPLAIDSTYADKPPTAEELTVKIKAMQEKHEKELSSIKQESETAKKQLADIEAAKYKPPTTEERLREIARKLEARRNRKPGEPILQKDKLTGDDIRFWNDNAK